MADHQTPGEKTAMRLAARAGALQRKTVSDGGEVYTGTLARRALRAMGARAMTLDEHIIVDDSFDEGRSEDQALYAHERFHQMESGGHGAQGARDSEEVAARTVERMVLHRSVHGDSLNAIMRDVESGKIFRDTAGGASGNGAPSGTSSESSGGSPSASSKSSGAGGAEAAYGALLSELKSHEAVVRHLARMVLSQIEGSERTVRFRSSPTSTI